MARDYYEILGVERGATEADIKKAFRRKARELHPDVSPDPDAERHFKEAASAYETLSDPQSRAVYDRYGEEGLRGQPGGGAGGGAGFGSVQDIFNAFFGGGGGPFGDGGPESGDDVGVVLQIDFAESASGVSRQVSFEVMGHCDTCEGSGATPGTEVNTCAHCGGAGQVRQAVRTPLGQFVQQQPCPACRGAGRVPESPCVECRGSGRRRTTRTIELDIPAGIENGQRIRMTGQGAAGAPGAPSGDLYVEVRVADDARFTRQGLDVVTRVAVPVTDAMVGATVTVPTVDGQAEVELRPGTQPGDEFVLRGQGFPSINGRRKGDQRVVVEVRIPRVQTDPGRKAVEALAEQLTERTYREDEGFFDRLKHAFR